MYSLLRVVKRGRNLKIHQTKAGCRDKITGSSWIKSKSEPASNQEFNQCDASSRTLIPGNRGVPHVENMGSEMGVDIEKSKAEVRKFEEAVEKSDHVKRENMKEDEEKRKELTDKNRRINNNPGQ